MNNKKGFTVVEVVISMVLVALMTMLVAKTIQYNVIVITKITQIRAALYKGQENAELAYGDALALVYSEKAANGDDLLGALAFVDPNPSNRSSPAVAEDKQRIYEREGDAFDHTWVKKANVKFFGVDVNLYKARISGNNVKSIANVPKDENIEEFDIYIGITNKIVPGYAMTVERPDYGGVKMRYASAVNATNSDGNDVPSVVYFMNKAKSLYGVPYTPSGPSAVKTIYQWYYTFHGDHTAATTGVGYTGPAGTQDGALSDTTTAAFGLIPGAGMTLETSTSSQLDISADEATYKDNLSDHVLGRFLYVTAAPGSVEGYMGDTVFSGMTYFSALPALTGSCVYECVIDPSLILLTLSDFDARAEYKSAQVNGQPLYTASAVSTPAFVSPGAANFTCGEQPIHINGECTVNSEVLAAGGRSYISRFMRVETGRQLTLSGGGYNALQSGKQYYAFVVSRLKGEFPVLPANASADDKTWYDMVMYGEHGFMKAPVISNAGITVSTPHKANAVNDWSVTMYALSGTGNIVFTPANYASFGASLDIAEIVLVSGDISMDSFAILQYLSTKYGVDTVNADNTARVNPVAYN